MSFPPAPLRPGEADVSACGLTPEEDSIPDEEESDIDDLLPADLWF